ncbi:LacI family transcriptional regulator [Paraoerskovia sediminicola]|uniref:LacI family transcriptional regulator n=1 Tax=Paraoerskovia sediminicola TaxID=1138587 RepID=A0ABM8G0E8_9CELL|nr:substrate-binding domain-containing protein [Paraoerskovia sediminicola]BDZ41476.1 LacI family transcriptional regulator [Paraoerskovia sediminicola]
MTSPVLPTTRRDQLLAALREDGTVRVSDISRRLGVTPVTIRRDITQLAAEGLVRRVHGGATLVPGTDAGGNDPASPATGSPTVETSSGTLPGDTPEQARPTRTLGMVVPSLDYYWPGVLQGARETATALGVRLVLSGSSYDVDVDRRQIARLAESVGVDGLLVAPSLRAPGGDALLAWIQSLDLPVVLVERSATRPPNQAPMESVVSDHALGASMAVHHLAGLGHRRVGLVASGESPTSRPVRAGWSQACEDLGLTRDGTPDLDSVDYSHPDWQQAADRALDACLESGTHALLVHSDPEAIALTERAQERGISVPDDLSIVAYDDEVAGLSSPRVTAVRPPRRTIGRAAVELLHRRLDDPGRPVHRVTVSPELYVRESTAPPPA